MPLSRGGSAAVAGHRRDASSFSSRGVEDLMIGELDTVLEARVELDQLAELLVSASIGEQKATSC
jgi:hypothetical protein